MITTDDTDRKAAGSPPSPRTYWLLCAVLAGIMFLVTWLRPFDRLGTSATDHEAVGTKLRQLAVESLTGPVRELTLEDLSDRVVLINLWGTWCGYCLQEFPHLVELEQKYGDRDDFELLAISYPFSGNDINALRDDTRRYLARIDAETPTYADSTRSTHLTIATATGTQGFPVTVLLDKQGTIRAVWVGYRDRDSAEMDRLVARLLAE